MKILITGGAGFIGSNFIHYWLINHPEDEIVNFDKLTYAGNLENLRDVENNPRYKFIKGDICEVPTVAAVMKNIDTIVHFAAESHVDRSILEPAAFVMTNVAGTQALLDAALKHAIKRFHLISTDEVFGSLSLGTLEKFNEETLYDPHSPYSASKAAADHLVRAYHYSFGLPITITNCSNNFGPYQYPEKLISLAITNVLEGKKVPVYGDGLNVRDWLYVEDHCRGIDLVLRQGRVGETYCLGGMTSDISNLALVKKILKIMDKGEEMIEYVKDRPGHDRRYAIDFSKASRDLGYQPQADFETYLEKTIKWYQDNQEWWRRVKSGEYREYYQKQYNLN